MTVAHQPEKKHSLQNVKIIKTLNFNFEMLSDDVKRLQREQKSCSFLFYWNSKNMLIVHKNNENTGFNCWQAANYTLLFAVRHEDEPSIHLIGLTHCLTGSYWSLLLLSKLEQNELSGLLHCPLKSVFELLLGKKQALQLQNPASFLRPKQSLVELRCPVTSFIIALQLVKLAAGGLCRFSVDILQITIKNKSWNI